MVKILKHEIGDRKRGRDLGHVGSASIRSKRYIYAACEDCGIERWVY